MVSKEENFHSLSASEVLKNFVSSHEGISDKVALLRLKKYGPNVLPEGKENSWVVLLLRQLKSVMIYILLVATLISFFLERYVDVGVILAVIVVNTAIGFVQESKAESAIKSLKKILVPKAKVFREGRLSVIPAKNLVPGDVILLEEGDRIPADARLIELKDFRTIESSLTGESLPVEKSLRILPEKTGLADKKNMVWLGTFVVAGEAKAIVISTGEETIVGQLAESIKTIPEKKTHFQEKTDTLAKQLAIISIIGALVIFAVGLFLRHMKIGELLIFTLASLVSGIPEGLPSVLSTVLAIGAYRMAKKKAIVRNRYATETLSVVDTIVTDKTGTLTENTMTVAEIFLPGQKPINISGRGWVAHGDFIQEGKGIVALDNGHLNKFLHIGSVCTKARLIKKEKDGSYKFIGDPTEAALLIAAEKAGINTSFIREKEKVIDELPFNPETKYRASLSVLSEKNGIKEIYVIGAPESVLKKSRYILKNGRKTRLTKIDIEKTEKRIDEMTAKAMRVIGFAYRNYPKNDRNFEADDIDDMIFVGVAGMIDPPRPEVADAIIKARRAGIRVIMATGDHKNTAIAIAKQIGLIKDNDKNALTGIELAEMNNSEFEKAVMSTNVFARLTPATKLKIAKVLQQQGHIVAMTGDGINDAPALKQADIGIAMGKIGTDVAREASEIILADDNFASIVNAIEEGRTVFVNTRQTSFFLVATGFAEHATIIATMIASLPLPVLPTQILWLNIVTAGVNDISLATEKSRKDIIYEKPRNKNENILNKEVVPFLLMLTLVMIILTIGVFKYYLPDGLMKARTAAFTIMSFTQIFSLLTMRSIKDTLFKIGLFSNKFVLFAFGISTLLLLTAVYLPFLQNVFEFVSLGWLEMIILFALSSLVFWSGEIYKVVRRKRD